MDYELLAMFPALGVIAFAYLANASALRAKRRERLNWALEMLRLGVETRLWTGLFFCLSILCALLALWFGKWFWLYAVMFMALWVNLKRQEPGQFGDARVVNGLLYLLWLVNYCT